MDKQFLLGGTISKTKLYLLSFFSVDVLMLSTLKGTKTDIQPKRFDKHPRSFYFGVPSPEQFNRFSGHFISRSRFTKRVKGGKLSQKI